MADSSFAVALLDVLRRYINPGDTWIEVGCGVEPLSIAAAALQPQGVLAIDRNPEYVAAAARRVVEAGLQETIRLACADFMTWPLIPAAHVVCRVRTPAVFDLLPRLRLGARGGVIVLTRVEDAGAKELADRIESADLRIAEVFDAAGRSFTVCRAATPASAVYQANFPI